MPRNPHADQPKGFAGAARLDLVLLCAVVALAAAVAAAFAWSRPTSASSALGYHQSGSLSYTAPTSPTSIYGSAGVQTGQPVYTQLVRTLDLTYTYRFASSVPSSLHGTEQLVATLRKGVAFARVVPLQPRTAFRGDTFAATATLHLSTFETIIAEFNKFTGNNINTYSLSISPNVKVEGRLGTHSLMSTFNRSTKFGLDETTLTPPSSTRPGTQTTSQTGGTTATQIGQPIVSSSSGSMKLPKAREVMFIAGISVFAARVISLAILALAFFLGALLARPMVREARSDDERVRIATKFSSSLVEVTSLPSSSDAVVELQSFNGLAQVSRRLECPLLHLPSEAGDEYAVVDNGTVYLYRIFSQSAQRLSKVVAPGAESPRHALPGRRSTAK